MSQEPAVATSVSRARRFWAAAALLTMLVVVTAALLHLQPSSAQPAAAPDTGTLVSVATVVQSDVATWDEFSGRLEAVERVDIRSRVAGTVQSVHFREGMLVKKGELLVTIDPAPYAAEVDRAEAQVVAAQARVSHTTSEQARAERLWGERAIAQREYDERVNALREANANLRAAQASLQSARLHLGYTQVRAPVAGRVGRLEVTVGNLIAAGPGAPVLTTLVSVNPIYASFDADEQAVARALRDLGGNGARAQLHRIPVEVAIATAPGTSFRGHLHLVDNQVNARSGTVRVRAILDNADGGLMPGQFARVRMGQSVKAPALLVNERAIGTDQSRKFVMVVGQDSKAEYREVKLGASVNGLRIVSAGLEPGEQVIVNGLQRVRPGLLVTSRLVPMDAKPETEARRDPTIRS